MIKKEFFEGSYYMEPLLCPADFTETSLEQALIQLKFDLNENASYKLYLGRNYIDEILRFKNGFKIFNIGLELQDDLIDEWYVVKDKKIVYSPGA